VGRRLSTEDLQASAEHLGRGNPHWFAQRLPPTQTWRLFADFRSTCAFLDIETTGMSVYDEVTAIALYDGRTVRSYYRGHNLEEFSRDVQAYRLLVTYNGKTFDLPFLERCLGCRFDQAHIDLRYVLKSLGLSGGLKNCERQLGLERPGLEDVDGFTAVLLWREYQRRQNRRALETLLAYNVQDTVVLETLMVHACNRKLAALEALPCAADYRLPVPTLPLNPYQPDAEIVRRVAGGMSQFLCR
jgi:uncharacterized protein YprB with RNaseH-like and TPR domain